MNKLSEEVQIAIKKSKILFCNGYGFDELSPGLIVSALDYAIEVGTSIFFDPGPRGRTLFTGTSEQKRALDRFLMMSDVLLLTSDEVCLHLVVIYVEITFYFFVGQHPLNIAYHLLITNDYNCV